MRRRHPPGTDKPAEIKFSLADYADNNLDYLGDNPS
jgi:hypothetical protein